MATSNENWQQKEKRELFCKSVNSMILRLPEGQAANMIVVLGTAKQIVDRAFELYPPIAEEGKTEVDFPTK